MTDTTPLSRFEGSMSSFLAQLSYGGSSVPGVRQRFEGDHHLLDLLDEAQRARTPPGEPLVTLGQLPDAVLRECVEKVELLRFGAWRLEGDSGDETIERLDAHFASMQAAHAALRRAQDEAAERRRRDDATRDAELAAAIEQRERALWGLPAA